MNSTDVSTAAPSGVPAVGAIDMKLEFVTIPVSDIDRAKSFYKGLGWREDADIVIGDGFRVVQLTPLHSECSIHFGKGLVDSAPGSFKRIGLVVTDIRAAREDLVARGVDVSEVFHGSNEPGPDPDRGSYMSYATFSDPDGNTWLLQEITKRLPGREWTD